MASTLYRGGRLHTRQRGATALLVDGERIAWVGDEAGAALLAADRTVWLDGNWLAPAFTEGHAHLAETGIATTNSVASTRSRADLQQALRLIRPFGRVLMAQGWDDSTWAEPPTAADLPDGLPAYVARADLHSALVNPALVALVPGIESLAGWSSDGWLRGEAHAAARAKAVELLTDSEVLDFALAGLALYASHGVATVNEMAGPAITGESAARRLQAELADRTDLPKTRLWWGELLGFDLAADLGAVGVGGDLVVDGSLGSRTAWLREPYTDDPTTRGIAYLSADQVAAHVVEATRRGVRTSFHAIGDAALDAVRIGFELAAAEVSEERIRAGNHQVEHAIMADADFIATCSRLNIAWSVQPAFAATWGGLGGMYSERIGADRLRATHPLGAAATAGIPIILGSDSPVTPVAPWSALQAATTLAEEGQALSAATAFRSHTASSHRRAGDPFAGALETGASATFAVWEVEHWQPAGGGARFGSDPRSGALELPEFASAPRCLLTVRDGEQIHAAGEL